MLLNVPWIKRRHPMNGKKKFTTTLDEELIKEIKKLAIDLDCSANELIEEGIHLFLKKHRRNTSRKKS
jgi:transaldolase